MAREHQQHRLIQQRMALEPSNRGGRDIVVALGHEQVELAGAKQRDAVLRLVFPDRAGQLLVPVAEPGHGRHHQSRGRAGERADDQAAAHGSLFRRELRLRGVELGEHPIGAGHQSDGRRGEPDPPPVAFQQRHADLALELSQRL